MAAARGRSSAARCRDRLPRRRGVAASARSRRAPFDDVRARARRRAHAPGALARDAARAARARRRALRRDRPRQGPDRARQAHARRRGGRRRAPRPPCLRRSRARATRPGRRARRRRAGAALAVGRDGVPAGVVANDADRRADRHRATTGSTRAPASASAAIAAAGRAPARPRRRRRPARARARGRRRRASSTSSSSRRSARPPDARTPPPLVAARARRRRAPARRRQRRLHRLPLRARARGRPGRGRPRRARARRRRRLHQPHHRPRRPRAPPPLFGDGAGAVGRAPRPSGGRHRAGRARRRRRRAPADLRATASEALIQMDGHETFRHAVDRMAEVTLEALARRRADARRDRPVRLPPGERPHHQGGRRAARARPGARRRLHRRARQHVGRVDPVRARRAREDGPPARPARACCWPRSAAASPGAAT